VATPVPDEKAQRARLRPSPAPATDGVRS